MATSQINSSADRAGAAENPPNQVGGDLKESNNNNNKNNTNYTNNNANKRTIYVRSQKDGVMKGVVILSETVAKMTTGYRLMLAGMLSYTSAKGYKKWPRAIENRA